MLGLLASLGFLGGAAAKNAYDDAAMKRYSTTYDSNGNRHYIDNKCREYINGERIRNSGYTDNEGIYHRTEIGLNSGKTYTDYVCPSEQLKKKYADEDREYYKAHGYLAYPAYNPQFKRKVTTEYSTGKTIAAVVWCYNIFTKEEHWIKFYTKPDAKQWEYDVVGEYDPGIEITKEEAEKYKFCGSSHSIGALGNKIWEGFDTRKPEGWDEAHRK